MNANTIIPMKNNERDLPALQDLNLLHVFDTIYQERNISRAAQSLGLAQPTVSNALARLRQAVGDPLFVRTHLGMEPTPRAVEMAPTVRQALALLHGSLRARRSFEPACADRTFTLFLTDLGEAFFLPRLLNRVRQVAPGIRLHTLPMPERDPHAALESGEVDLAIGNLPDLPQGFYQQRLFKEYYVCIARDDHPLWRSRSSARRLRDAYHAVVQPQGTGHSAVEKALARLGLQDRIALRVQNFLVLPSIVRNTDLVAMIPHSAAGQLAMAGVGIHPAPIALSDFVVRQCWHERFHADAGNQWLRQQIAELFTEGDSA